MVLDEHTYFVLIGLVVAAILALWIQNSRLRRQYGAIISADKDARQLRAAAEEEADRLTWGAKYDARRLREQTAEYTAKERLDADSYALEVRAEAKAFALEHQKEAKSFAAQFISDAEQRKKELETQTQQEAEAKQARASARASQILSEGKLAAQELVDKARHESSLVRSEAEVEATRIRLETDEMREDYREKRGRYDDLIRTVAAMDDQVELADLGFYEPHFSFDTSERFKEEIREVKQKQKVMVRAKTAIVCHTKWSVDNSRRKGQTLTNRAIRLTARAFNNECDAAVAKVRWNNVMRLELRIQQAFEAINRANESQDIWIERDYMDLKLEELRLTYEYHEKRHAEREHKAELRRQEREEAQLRRDAEEAAKEADEYARLLKQARHEVSSASAERLGALNIQIAQLSKQLEEAEARNERAISMAQQTRSGYVYVVSNVGSFGEHVCKIGMTRRLDPMDRVRELSAASVPFPYDTHAMIYSQDAPGMESALHHTFEDRRVNRVNQRKEFFHVTVSEVKREVGKLFPDADFVEGVEARDFRETRSIEERLLNAEKKTEELRRFPDEL